MACSCGNTCSRCNRTGGRIIKKQSGGYLQGPSHEQGGIPAVVSGNTPIELEGGEYIINAQTVNAVGTQFLDQLNSTATTHHLGGFQPGQLGNGSYYRKGGKIRGNNMSRRNMRRGGRMKKMPHGGRAHGNMRSAGRNRYAQGIDDTHNYAGNQRNGCPEGMHMMPDGNCMQGVYHGAVSGQNGGDASLYTPGRMEHAPPMEEGIFGAYVTWGKGGRVRKNRKMQMGGRTSCPPGQHMMPNGTCMEGAYHGASSSGGGYRRGGQTRNRRYRNGGATGRTLVTGRRSQRRGVTRRARKYASGGITSQYVYAQNGKPYNGSVIMHGGQPYTTTTSGTYGGSSKLLKLR